MHQLHHRMISLMMFCAHIASWYDSTDDVLCAHHIVVWFHWRCSVRASHWLYDSTDDVLCTHHIALWFYWWCSVHTRRGNVNAFLISRIYDEHPPSLLYGSPLLPRWAPGRPIEYEVNWKKIAEVEGMADWRTFVAKSRANSLTKLWHQSANIQ